MIFQVYCLYKFNKFMKILDLYEYIHKYVTNLSWNFKKNSIHEWIAEPNSFAERF